MADTTEKSTNAGTTQEAVQQQTVDGKSITGKPPQKPFTGDQIEQSATDSNSTHKPSSQNSAGQDALSGRQRHGTNERTNGEAPSSTGTSDSAVNGSAIAHTASPDDSIEGRTTPQQHAGEQQSSAGAVNSGSKKRSAAEASSADGGRSSRSSGAADTGADPSASATNGLTAPGTGDDSKRAKVGDPVVLGADSDKGPVKPSNGNTLKDNTGLGSAVDASTKPDLNKQPPHDAGEPKPAPVVGADAASGAGKA